MITVQYDPNYYYYPWGYYGWRWPPAKEPEPVEIHHHHHHFHKEAAPAKPRTFIAIILDESGSMCSVRDTTIRAYNEFLQSQQKETADEAFLSLRKFNTETTCVHESLAIAAVPALSRETYTPYGCTALYDAIGDCLNGLAGSVLPADRAIVVILTDGEENSSKRFTKPSIARMIRDFEGQGNWSFVYLGANQDAWVNANGLGISYGNTVTFHRTRNGTTQAINLMSSSLSGFRAASAVQTTGFFSKDDQDALQGMY